MNRIVRAAATVALIFPAAVLPTACASSANVEGGTLVPRGAEPTGTPMGDFRMIQCHDLAGGTLPDRDGQVSVVKKADGKVVLMELRADTDSVVVGNVTEKPEAWVFALALARESGNRYYREYTVPKTSAGGAGKFIIAKEWTGKDTGDGFGGTYKAASVTCALVPLQGSGPRR
ncbi:MAG TPA: hypothetical protein VF395_09865 [Polyangiaceae bacterium]